MNGPPHTFGLEVRHLDGNKSNNDPTNLAWGTRKQNAEDMMRHGGHRAQTHPETYGPSPKISESQRRNWATNHGRRKRMSGERNPTAKLTGANVTEIVS